jgi:DMSO/TMAO reductase YedYZ molybdopterin-dependent catalytic subunit
MSILDPLKRVQRLRRSDALRRAAGRKGDESARTPPGQALTNKFPVLTAGPVQRVAHEDWRLRLFGLVAQESELDWAALQALPQQTITCDIHCVTRWSKLDTTWTGVPFSALHEIAGALPEADHVMLHCYGGYTTNMRLDEMLEEGVLLAHTFEGQPLEAQHGGPVRALVPKLYLWKSAKWIHGVEYLAGNRPGFWEGYGYHMHGDPWTEERFG